MKMKVTKTKTDVAEKKKEKSRKKSLPRRRFRSGKRCLSIPCSSCCSGAMWLIFAPSGDKDEQQPDGFNSELPIPKDEAIVGDKRTAYEQEAMRNKETETMRSLQDFAFMLGEEEIVKYRVNTSIPSDSGSTDK
jgi:hypothetical protein